MNWLWLQHSTTSDIRSENRSFSDSYSIMSHFATDFFCCVLEISVNLLFIYNCNPSNGHVTYLGNELQHPLLV